MSAFMVEDKLINRIVTYMDGTSDESGTRKRLDELGIYTNEKLGKEMFALNAYAIEQRYGKGEPEKFRPLNYKYTPILSNTFQVLKDLHCFLYQCTEGDTYEKELYKILEDYVHGLEYNIISDMPMYKMATWG